MSQNIHALNPRQREAVLHGNGPLLILAGAGTGKTRTLAYRIASLVERGVPPDTILAVAFTNKSADELKERVRKLLKKGTKPPVVSTFHSFCVRVLRRDIEHLGYKRNFTIYDTSDQLSALKEALREVRMVGRGDADAKRVLAAISRAKNEGRAPDPGDGTDPYAILAAEAAPRYASALKAYNAVDFDDLLLLTLRLFREFP
jgi:DNA helicase-2/ATP-dependent DNA helicase PcrA